jgi:tripartite-type tricarboxylate transporter receptor subunit TctC
VKRSLSIILGLLVLGINAPAAQAASYDEKAVADFYRGKTVTIVVGHSAGGGFDRYARAIARHLGKYIAGNPAILVNNMVGAGTMVSANYTYNQAPRDGTVINSFDGGLWPSQLYGSSAVQFDMTKFNYIGAPDIFKYIMVVTKKSGIAKMEDYMTGAKEVVVGAVPNTSIQHAATFLRDVMGAKVKLVTGFKGTAEIRLASSRGGEQRDHRLGDAGRVELQRFRERRMADSFPVGGRAADGLATEKCAVYLSICAQQR